jgi:MFS family permease
VSDATPTPTRGLRRFVPVAAGVLTGPTRRFLVATILGAFGAGFTFSLFALYCVHIRHIPIGVATTIIAWEALVGLVVSPAYGTLIDRVGPSRVLAIALPIASVSIGAVGFAPTLPWIVLVMTLFSMFGAATWSAGTVLLTRIVAESHRTDVFGLNFMLLNVGIGVGSIVGTSIINLHSAATFQVVYLLTGACCLANFLALHSLRAHGGPPPVPEHHERSHEGWREVFSDRRLVHFLVPSLLMMVCGYGSVEAGIPLFVTGVAHLSVHVVGLVFFCNTSTIVLGQAFVIGGIRGRSRSLLLGVVGAAWGLSWLFATASVFIGVAAGVAALCVGQVIFALGETVFQPIAPVLVNELAPEHLRGRYNSLVGTMWTLSAVIGQLIAGAFLEFHQGRLWTVCLAAGAVLGGLGLTTLRRTLSPTEDGLLLEAGASSAATAT